LFLGPAIPSLTSFSNTALPDPFTFANGAKVVTTADWACRRAEISTLMQMDELGTMPGTPTSVTASFSGSTLTITVTDAGKSITFSPTITYPSSGTAPFPAIIGIGGLFIPQPAGVAVINFDNNDIAQQTDGSSRGKGKFFTLYGSGHSAGTELSFDLLSSLHLNPSVFIGATLAWAWAVRRIMDALEKTPAARINTARVGVSGCSRNGKGAIIAGACIPFSWCCRY
jgi:hypothetical protein